jgi:curved DNA-binding protein CbpA
MAEKGLYAVLGIEQGASLPTIKRAYRRLVFSVHPDVGLTPDPGLAGLLGRRPHAHHMGD